VLGVRTTPKFKVGKEREREGGEDWKESKGREGTGENTYGNKFLVMALTVHNSPVNLTNTPFTYLASNCSIE